MKYPIAELLTAALALNLCYDAARKVGAFILDVREKIAEKKTP